jgi:hypothetical protein
VHPLLGKFRPGGRIMAAASAVLISGALATLTLGSETGLEPHDASFDQLSAVHGSADVTTGRAFRGSHSMRARYRGGGANGYARGLFEVSWHRGDTVTYRAAFLLPHGFHRAMQGQVALMRWDNWPAYEGAGDSGGIVVYGSDKRARLVRGHYNEHPGGNHQQTLGGSFRLPEGRWFTLSARQRLSREHPRSVVRLDGRRVISSAQLNFYGRAIERIRYGIVAIGAGMQRRPLRLWVDDAEARRRG